MIRAMQITIENYRTELLSLVDSFCELTGMTREYVAGKVVKDRRFFSNIEDGSGCTVETYLRVKQWLEDNMPLTAKETKRKNRITAAEAIVN